MCGSLRITLVQIDKIEDFLNLYSLEFFNLPCDILFVCKHLSRAYSDHYIRKEKSLKKYFLMQTELYYLGHLRLSKCPFYGRHDTEHNNTHHNDTQHNNTDHNDNQQTLIIMTLIIMTLIIMTLSITTLIIMTISKHSS